MSENNNSPIDPIKDGLGKLITLENVAILRDYLLGYRKNGKPRSVYDVIKDQTQPGKGGKSKKRKAEKFSLYIEPGKKNGKGKKKKKKKKSHWEY